MLLVQFDDWWCYIHVLRREALCYQRATTTTHHTHHIHSDLYITSQSPGLHPQNRRSAPPPPPPPHRDLSLAADPLRLGTELALLV